MIPEIGHIFLISALVLSFWGGIIPLYAIWRQNNLLLSSYRALIIGVSIFSILSFFILIYSFYQDDFSLVYVATNSNTNLPLYYKLAATWGAHEGSLLLWISILCIWSVSYLAWSKDEDEEFNSIVIMVLSQIIFSFIAFTLFTSNPFERILPIPPLEGIELNPLLQDFAFTIHPPLLYAGYSGLSLPFAIAVATMISGNINSSWASIMRPWALLSCFFLTLGITIGSWWAYYELGWGGWWFWDPVENAAFVPWLISVALFHSLIVTEKRSLFKNWSLLLTVLAFASCLLGTFLVRSGVLTSVHSFALDPERGVFILLIFAYFILAALGIYYFKNNTEKSNQTYSLFSKEFGLLLNNLLLVILAISIMFGTLFPLIYEALSGGKQISVGAPYYEILILPFALALSLLQGVALYLSWKDTASKSFLTRFLMEVVLLFLVFNLFIYLIFDTLTTGVLIASIMFSFIVAGNLIGLFFPNKFFNKGYSVITKRVGVVFSHLGTAILIVGVAVVSSYSLQNEVKLRPGDSYSLGSYEIEFKELKKFNKNNYSTEMATLDVKAFKGNQMQSLYTEKRYYPSANQSTSEAAIKPRMLEDLYITLGDNLGDDAWSFRVQVKPFVRWIWMGAIMIGFGALISSIQLLRRRS